MNRTTGLILAGGRSARFGTDKALHRIDGQTLIERVYAAVQATTSPVFISIGDPAKRYDLPLRHIADIYPNSGPLGGLHAGLLAAETEWVLAVAVDLPFITPASLDAILARRADNVDAVVARCGDRIQPLCGCYRTSLAGRIEERLRAKQFTVMAFLDTIRVDDVDLPEKELRNLNRPKDAGSDSGNDTRL